MFCNYARTESTSEALSRPAPALQGHAPGRSAFAVVELLIVAALAGGILVLSIGLHMLCACGELQTDSALRSASGQGGSIYSLSVSMETGTALTREIRDTVRLRELSSGRDLYLPLPIGEVTAAAQSLGGDVIVAGYRGGMLAIARGTDEQPRIVQRAHEVAISSVACSPDGRFIATSDVDGTVSAWTADGTLVWTVPSHMGSINELCYSHTGKLLASAGADHEIHLWDAASGQRVQTLSGHNSSATRLAFSGDDRMLVSGSIDQTIRVWDLTSGRQLWKAQTGSPVLAIDWSPHQPWIVSSGYARELKVWDSRTGRVSRTFTGHTDHVRCLQFSPDGKALFAADYDGVIRKWEM